MGLSELSGMFWILSAPIPKGVRDLSEHPQIMPGTRVYCAPVLLASDYRHVIINVQQPNQKALWEQILVILCVGVCGFPKRLKLHLQRSTHGTERLGLRDFLKPTVGPGPVAEGLSLGLVRVE